MIFPEQRGDFLLKTWNGKEFETQLDILTQDSDYIAVSKNGFIRLNLLQKIWEAVKGFFGGTNLSQHTRVNADALKFLYCGETHGLINDKEMRQLKKLASSPFKADPAILNLFTELLDYRKSSSPSRSKHFEKLRDIVTDYHTSHALSLRPGFWTRKLTPPSLDLKSLQYFGSTRLQLSEKALQPPNPNPLLALSHLEKAFELKNDAPQFQDHLAVQLLNLSSNYSSQLSFQKRKIQELFLQLGRVALANQLPADAKNYLSNALNADPKNLQALLEIGKLYLTYREFDEAQAFLGDLLKAYPQDLPLLFEIANAYWKTNKFQKAIDIYENALNQYEKEPKTFPLDPKQIAAAYHCVGSAHLTGLTGSVSLTEAEEALFKAFKIDPADPIYQKDLCAAYEQLWKNSNCFSPIEEDSFLEFLSLAANSILQKNKDSMIPILMGCSENHFKAHNNQKGHDLIEKALAHFSGDADVIIRCLDLALSHGDSLPLEEFFEEWGANHYANPYLKKKIGDALWNSDQQAAMTYLQESLDLFQQRLSLCRNTPEELVCKQHIANIEIRIGSAHLQPSGVIFKTISYDQAIQQYEKAVSLDPISHSATLFDLYLKAANEELNKAFLLRNTDKIINYYFKAFQISFQEGSYLIDLLNLYFSKNRVVEAVDLYDKIQQQPWYSNFNIPPSLLAALAKTHLQLKKNPQAMDCFKKAHEKDPSNSIYKENYFQTTLNYAQDRLKEIQKEQSAKRMVVWYNLAKILTECWKEGFKSVEKLEGPFHAILSNISQLFAFNHIHSCKLPLPINQMQKDEVTLHKKRSVKHLQVAVNHFNKAIEYQPDNAALHFDKGMLLAWMVDYDGAFNEMELAVKYQPRNPFYHRQLADLYSIVHSNSDKYDEHKKEAEKLATQDFQQDYQVWTNEFMSSVKTKDIDPHAYTKPKGWFG